MAAEYRKTDLPPSPPPPFAMLTNVNAITANAGNAGNANRTINQQVIGGKNAFLMRIISTTTTNRQYAVSFNADCID